MCAGYVHKEREIIMDENGRREKEREMGNEIKLNDRLQIQLIYY